jgi:hypothetical protein
MDPLLEQALNRLGERIKQRTHEREAQSQAAPATPPTTALIIPFPQPWAEAMRACPLAMLRSALFGVVRRGRRQSLEDVEIAAWPGVSIRYTGHRLDQADLDVWMQAVHLFRHSGLGSRLHLSAHSFLKAIGRATGNLNHQWLRKSFTRMIACAVVIKVGRYSYAGNLVHEFWLDEETGKYVLSINPHLAALFADGYSLLEWAQRQALGNKDLAKWLLGYINTHQATVLKPHRIGLDKLQRLCGAEMEPKDFKRWTKRYMDAIKALEAVAAWHFTGTDDNILEFIRPPQKASRRSRKKQ